jgi:hypothetical protein
VSTTISDGELIEKDPDAALVWGVNWDKRWASGVQLASSAWTVTGPDSALTTDNPSFDAEARTTQARFSGGTLGAKYLVTNRVVTAEAPAQTDDASFYVVIVEK